MRRLGNYRRGCGLITRHRAFAATYRGLLCIAVSTRPACTAPAERMSV